MAVASTSAWFAYGPDAERQSLDKRLALYANSTTLIDATGHGVGSFWSVYPTAHDAIRPTPTGIYHFSVRPRTAHNDALTLTVETGLIGLALAGLFVVIVLYRPRSPGWYIFGGFLAIGLFNFPLFHTPATAFLAFLGAGHAVRCRSWLCDRLSDW